MDNISSDVMRDAANAAGRAAAEAAWRAARDATVLNNNKGKATEKGGGGGSGTFSVLMSALKETPQAVVTATSLSHESSRSGSSTSSRLQPPLKLRCRDPAEHNTLRPPPSHHLHPRTAMRKGSADPEVTTNAFQHQMLSLQQRKRDQDEDGEEGRNFHSHDDDRYKVLPVSRPASDTSSTGPASLQRPGAPLAPLKRGSSHVCIVAPDPAQAEAHSADQDPAQSTPRSKAHAKLARQVKHIEGVLKTLAQKCDAPQQQQQQQQQQKRPSHQRQQDGETPRPSLGDLFGGYGTTIPVAPTAALHPGALQEALEILAAEEGVASGTVLDRLVRRLRGEDHSEPLPIAEERENRWGALLRLRGAELASYGATPPISDVVASVRNPLTGVMEELQFINVCLEGGGVWGFLTTGFLWALERKGIRFYTVGGSSVGSIITAALASTGPIEQPKMDNLLAGLLHNLNFETVASLDDAVEPTAEDAEKYGVPLDELRIRWRQAAHMALSAHDSLMVSSNGDPDLGAPSASTTASAAAARATALAAQSHAAILGSMSPGSLFAPPPAPRSSTTSLNTATPRGSSDVSSSDLSLGESDSQSDEGVERSRRAPGFFGKYKAKFDAARKAISYLKLYRRRKKNLKDLSAIMNEHGGILSGQALGRVVDITLMDCRRRQCCISLRRAVPSLHGFVSPYLGATPLPSTDLTASLPEELLLCLAQPTSALAELDHVLTENTNALFAAGAKLQLARKRAQPFLPSGLKVRGRGSAPDMGLEGGDYHRPLPRRCSTPAAAVAGHVTASDATRQTDTCASTALSELARQESVVEELVNERHRLISCVNHRNGMLLDTTTENVVQRLADSAARLPLRHRTRGIHFHICTKTEGPRDREQVQAKSLACVPLQPPRLRMVALEARSGARMVFPEHAPAIATDARLVPLSEYVRASSAVPIIYAAHRHLHRFTFSLPLNGDTILHAAGLAAEAAMSSADLPGQMATVQDGTDPSILPRRSSVARFFTAVRGAGRHQSGAEREEPHAETSGQITPPRTGMFGRRYSQASASPSSAARQLFPSVSGSPGFQSVGRGGVPPSPSRGNRHAGPGELEMPRAEDSTWGKAVLQVPFAGLTPAEMEAADLVSAAHLEAHKRNGGPVSVTHDDVSIAQLWAPMRTRPSAAATFRSHTTDLGSDSVTVQGTETTACKLRSTSCLSLKGPTEGGKAETAALTDADPDDFELFQQRVTAAAIYAGVQAASTRGKQGEALPGNVSRSALSAVRTLISNRADKTTEVAPEAAQPGGSRSAAVNERKSSSRHVDWEAVHRLHPDNAVHRLAASRKPPARKSAAVSSVSMNYHGPAPEEVRLVDGGVISNFPFDLFHEAHNGPPPMPSIGFRVGVKRRRLFQFNTFLSFAWSCLQGLRQYGDGLLFSRLAVDDTNVREVEEPENIAFSKFNLSIEEQMIMFNIGVDEALRFLYHNPDVSSNVDAAPKGAFDWECYKQQVARAWRMPGSPMPDVASTTAGLPFESGRKAPRKVFESQKNTFV